MAMIEAGASVAFTNATDKLGGINGKDLESTTVYTLTGDTDTMESHNFRSALDLADYDTKINENANKLRDSDLYRASENSGTHYDRAITLREFSTHITQKIVDSIKGSTANENINLYGTLSLARPNADKEAGENNDTSDLYEVGDKLSSELSMFDGINQIPSIYGGMYIGSLKNTTSEAYKDHARNYTYGIKMGEAKVLNPDFQFNEVDDVRSDMRSPKLGRLYAERIYDFNLPTMLIQPGTIDISLNSISAVSRIISTSSQNHLTSYLKTGDTNGITWAAMKIGGVIKSGIANGAKTVLDTHKWYHWAPAIQSYMHNVNEMLIELATWMGLINFDATPVKEGITGVVKNWKEQWDKLWNTTSDKDEKNAISDDTEDSGTQSTGGCETNTKMTIVEGYLGGGVANFSESTGKFDTNTTGTISALHILPIYNTKKIRNGNYTALDKALEFVNYDIVEACVPFGLSRGVSVSESFNNETTQHPLQSQYNEKYEEANQSNLTMGIGLNGNSSGLQNLASKVIDAGKGASSFKEMALGIGADAIAGTGNVLTHEIKKLLGMHTDEMGMVIAGAGRFVLPQIWTDSSFERSYSISLKFRSPYGSRLSIYENTMVPLLFLIAFAAPRAIGLSSYTNPYYVKAFSKGLFSCDMGMISSLSISRGEDKNDRTYEGFFRTVSVNITIRDMLPNLQMSIDAGNWSTLKSGNTGMINYMCNLAGIDFIERANLGYDMKNALSHLQTMYNDFGSNARVWMAQNFQACKVITKARQAFGTSDNFYADRTYHMSI